MEGRGRLSAPEYKNNVLIWSTLFPQIVADGDTVTDLETTNVTIVFTPTTVAVSNVSQYECVYWNFTANQDVGGWETDGCLLVNDGDSDGSVKCVCDHLTNFAVLLVSFLCFF